MVGAWVHGGGTVTLCLIHHAEAGGRRWNFFPFFFARAKYKGDAVKKRGLIKMTLFLAVTRRKKEGNERRYGERRKAETRVVQFGSYSLTGPCPAAVR